MRLTEYTYPLPSGVMKILFGENLYLTITRNENVLRL